MRIQSKKVKGTLALNFLYKKNVSNQPVTFDSPSMKTTITQTHNVQTLQMKQIQLVKKTLQKLVGKQQIKHGHQQN